MIRLDPTTVEVLGGPLDGFRPEVVSVDLRPASSAAPTVTPPRVDFDRAVEAERDDLDADYSGWFCVATDPFLCPAEGCGFVAHYMTAAHMVVVWPRADDPALLGSAQNAMVRERNPRVVEYEQGFGPCIAWDEWDRIGRPVHGMHVRPEGWKARPWRV